MALAAFSQNQLEQISRTLADAFTRTDLSALLLKCNIPESGGTPKWERTLLALAAKKRADHCGNNGAAFIQSVMDPVRFVGRQSDFTRFQETLNQVLAFAALRLGEDVNSGRTCRCAHCDRLNNELVGSAPNSTGGRFMRWKEG